jgi:hypothetical protein
MILILKPGLNAAPVIRTAVLGGPDEGVMVKLGIGTTVRRAVPWIPVRVSAAVICVLPAPTPVASPCDPTVFETVAAEVFDEDHVALDVRSCVLWSE